MAALKALSGVFIGMAGIEMGTQLIEGVYRLYEKWGDVDAAVNEYTASVKKSQSEDVVNVRSLEDAALRLHDLNTEYTNYIGLSKEMSKGGWAQLSSDPRAAGWDPAGRQRRGWH